MIRVKATAKGYFGQLREPGDEFEIPDEKALGNWMEVVEEKPARRARRRRVDGPGSQAAAAGDDHRHDPAPPAGEGLV